LAKEIETKNEITKIWFWGQFFEKTLPMGISSQNTLLNNFSPVRPILTGNILIDSARLAETHGNIKIFPIPF
jgi:hypothetical protein